MPGLILNIVPAGRERLPYPYNTVRVMEKKRLIGGLTQMAGDGGP